MRAPASPGTWDNAGCGSLYEAVKVKRLFQGSLHFSFNFVAVSLFDLKARFSAPTHMSREPTRAGAVKVGRHCGIAMSINVSRPHLDSSEHDGPLTVVGMTSRGEPASAASKTSRRILVFGGPSRSVTMMHGCASVSEAPRRRTHSVVRHESHAAARGRPPPRTVIGDPYVRIKPKLSDLLSVDVHWISRPDVSITLDA